MKANRCGVVPGAFVFVLLIAASCTGDENPGSSKSTRAVSRHEEGNEHEPEGCRPNVDEKNAEQRAALRATVQDVSRSIEERVAAAAALIEGDTCFLQSDVSCCEWDEYLLEGESAIDAKNAPEAVLLIDDLLPTPRFLKYSGRILGYYTIEEDGQIRPETLRFRLPQALGDTLLAFGSAHEVPATQLNGLASATIPARYPSDFFFVPPHGIRTFGVLIERIPQNPIVMVSAPTLSLLSWFGDEVCSLGESEDPATQVASLRNLADRIAGELRAIIGRHNVRYINASFGHTLKGLQSNWASLCNSPLPELELQKAMLMAYEPLYQVLYNTPGVFGSDSALAFPLKHEFAPFDTKSSAMPNRLRIGVFDYLGNELPVQGVAHTEDGWNPSPADREFADVYINGASLNWRTWRKDRPLSAVGAFGWRWGWEPMPRGATSWVNPLGLAKFIHIRHSPEFAGRAMSNELIADIIHSFVPVCNAETQERCLYQDPLWHEQFDQYPIR